MPTNPSQRLRRSFSFSPSSPSSPKRGTHGNKIVLVIMDELATDERSTDGETMNGQTTNEQLINDQSTNGRSPDEQPTKKQITDEASGDGIKNQVVTDGMRTDAPATDTFVTNTEVGDPHGIVPSRVAKFFAWALVLLAFFSPFLRPPAFVLSVVRFPKDLLLKLNPINTLSPILVKVVCVCLGLRLLYALCQDFMTLLIVLHPVPVVLKAFYRYFLALLRAMFQDLVTLLEPLHHIFTKLNPFYQRLLTSLEALYWSLLALFRQLHLALGQLKSFPLRLLAGLRLYSRVWKWVLVICTVLLSGICTILFTPHHNPGFLSQMICPIHVVGHRLPFCQPPPFQSPTFQPPPLDNIWSSKLTMPHEGFATVMGRLGQDDNLARELVHHHFALRDLASGSTLKHKVQIAGGLQSLQDRTWDTSLSLSKFTTKFTGVVNTLRSFDEWALRLIEDKIKSDERTMVRVFMSRVLEAMYPLTGFAAHRPSEEIIKEVFRLTTGYMREKIKTLVDDMLSLSEEINTIQRILDEVKDKANEDIRRLPPRDILGELWDHIAPVDEYKSAYSATDTRKVLVDLVNLYKVASSVVEDILKKLSQVKAQLRYFEIERIQPTSLLKQYPLKVLGGTLRQSMEDLETSQQKLQTGSGTRMAEMIRPDKNAKKNTKS